MLKRSKVTVGCLCTLCALYICAQRRGDLCGHLSASRGRSRGMTHALLCLLYLLCEADPLQTPAAATKTTF